MTRHDWVLAAALGVSMAMALRARALGEVWALVPVDPKRPTERRQGDRFLFRFTPIRALSFWTTLRPRLLLTLLLFALWAPLFDRLGPGAGDPVGFLQRFSGWFFWLALVAGGSANLWLIPFFVLAMPVMAGFDHDPVAIGVVAGVLFGLMGGKVLCLNYLTLVADLRHELRQRSTRDGRPLGLGARLKRWLQLLLLRAVPLMILYEVVRFFWPQIDLGRIASEMTGISLGRFALVLGALGLGLNVTLSVVPLFREMLERASLLAANGFNELVHHHAAQEKAGQTEDAAKFKMFLEGFSGADGQWQPFGSSQVAILYLATMVMAGNGLNQTVGKLVHAGLSPDDPVLRQLGTVLSWMGLIANCKFLTTYAGRRLLRRARSGNATEHTVATYWRAAREPGLVVVCWPEHGEVRVETPEDARREGH